MSDKGDTIRFVRGTFKGKTGWLNSEKGETSEQVYVIVDLGNRRLKRTRVNKSSVKPLDSATRPSTYAEAVMQQCPDVEEKLDQLCGLLAKCKIEKDPHGLFNVLTAKLDEATRKQKAKPSSLYRDINFPAAP
jgi:hypothetical protein